MVASTQELLNQLKAGTLREHRHINVQLKESWKQDAGKDLSAYGNKIDVKAAYVVVGVTDKGVVVGNPEPWARTTEESVSQHINQYLDPGQACKGVECFDAGCGWIVIITVKNPGAVVHWNGSAYRGSGTTKLPMEPHEVIEMTLQLPGLQDYTAQPWNVSLKSPYIQAFGQSVVARRPESFRGDSGLFQADVLDVLGLSGKQVARLLFGDGHFRVVKFDKSGLPLLNEVRTPLYALLTEEFRDEVQNWSASQLRLANAPFPSDALKEGIANAVAHACYFERDGEIIAEVYADRLEITNLCLTESKAFANKWFSRDHYTVNRVMMEALRLGGSVDELGLGKSVIFRDSIIQGKRQPEVIIENAGRYNRWRLVLYGGLSSERHIRLLKRLNDKYTSARKALLAFSLALWSDQPVTHIRNYIGKDAAILFEEVLHDLTGPVFYLAERDQLILNRWARILLHEGMDSKQPSDQELDALFELVTHFCGRYAGGVVTPADLRKYGEFGNSKSEMTLTSRILGRWVKEGRMDRVGTGKYRLKASATKAVPAAHVESSDDENEISD